MLHLSSINTSTLNPKGKQSAVNDQCLLNIVKCFFAILQPLSKQSAVNHQQAERGTTAHLIQNADGRLPTRSIPIMPRLSGPLVNHVTRLSGP